MFAGSVPKQLTDERKRICTESATEFLCRYDEEGKEFLESIVTGDETKSTSLHSENEDQLKQRRHQASPNPE